MSDKDINYRKMWEDLGADAGRGYHEIKFRPTYRIGLTNFLREEVIYKFLAPEKDDVVLDIGCASGRQIFKIANQIKEGHGIDIAESFISEANDHKAKLGLKNVFFRRAEGERIPYEDNTFNKIICAEVLEHVFDHNAFLTEMLRVLRPGGLLVLSVPNLNADGTLWGRFLRFIGVRKFVPITDFSHAGIKAHGDAHVREFTKKTMTEWLATRELKVEDAKTASFINGPYFDFLLKVPLHISPLRWGTIWFERILTYLNLNLGRQLIVKAVRIDTIE